MDCVPGAYTLALRHAVPLVDEIRAGDGEHLRALHRRFAVDSTTYDRWRALLRPLLQPDMTLEHFACEISRSLRK